MNAHTAIARRTRRITHLLQRGQLGSGQPLHVVVIRGESGAGKSRLVAGMAAELGRPVTQVNCASLRGDVARAELFGHAQGAFTGAVTRAGGRFGEADGGLLWLDEAHHLPPAVQHDLLTVLDTGVVRPVGAGSRPVAVDVVVVLTTNRDLRELVLAGEWAHDLYWRLRRDSRSDVELRPLRERPDAIAEVIHAECARLGVTASPSLVDALVRDPARWEDPAVPGNARALQGVIADAFDRALEHGRDVLLPNDLMTAPAVETERPARNTDDVLTVAREAGPSGLSSSELAERIGVAARDTARARAEEAGLELHGRGRAARWYHPDHAPES